jgi:hypothetical protein
MRLIPGIKPNPRLAAFFICLFISFVFWLITILSKEYTHTLRVGLTYVHVPSGKSLSKGLPDSVEVTLSGTGLHLLMYLWLTDEKVLEADLGQLRFDYTSNQREVLLNLNQQLLQFSEQIHLNSLKVIKITPGQLICFLEQPYMKVVPIKPLIKWEFSNEYDLSGPISFSPKKVVIRGSRDDVEKIDTLFTESLLIKNSTATQTYVVPLVSPMRSVNFSIPCSRALITVPVEKYTEAETNCDIEAVGMENSYLIKLFPEKAKVYYQVPLSKYKTVKPQDFTVVADASKADKGDGKNLLKLTLSRTPEFTRNCRLEPPSVEYVLTKKP